ncbi:MAG TPA: ATP-binding protein, partial [Ferruginibacter sp.]|nr:ATP-binding protein [Ferruginibacter sp.]
IVSDLKNEKLSPEKKYCHISISDNGIGFEQEYSEKIFDLFQRLHSRTQYHGTGIGLAIVKKIVENHHGFITATSKLNKGATFDIYIPAP